MADEMPDKYRKILNSNNNGPTGQAFSTKEAILWNVVKTEELTQTIKDANQKNDRTQTWFLWLTLVGVVLAATQLVQVMDILIRWVGK